MPSSDVTVPIAVKSLYEKYSHDVARSLRSREDGLRNDDAMPTSGRMP